MQNGTNGMMKASVFSEYGGPEVLHVTDVPRPKPGPGEALIYVRATALNYADIMVREGRYRPNEQLPHILGSDYAGVLAELGPDAKTSLKVGQRVTGWWVVHCGHCEQCLTGNPNRCVDYKYLGSQLWGAYAQYVKIPASNLVALPDNMSWEEAAAFCSTFGTAWHMLVTRANLRPGETILVHAAGAAVGMAAIQIAKLIGAYVYATSSAEWKLERAKQLGADEVINYVEQDFQQEIMRLTGKRGVDVVAEQVGGDVWEKSIRSLTRGGRLVTVGGTQSYDVRMNVAYVFHKELTIIGSNSVTRRELERMIPLWYQGKLKPVIDSVYPLEEAPEAHKHVAARANFGKVVLTIP